jgi:hypothetical protein
VIPVDVFLTFSLRDMGAADKICGALESEGIQCWMPHRDVVRGQGYLGPVLEALDHCRALVILISSNTTTSNIYVVERAVARPVPVVWLMLDHATPRAEFEKFRESALVIDISMPPLESHFRALAARMRSLLNPARGEEQHPISPAAAVEPTFEDGSENHSDNKVVLRVQLDRLLAGLPPPAVEDAAIDRALRTAAAVLSEIHTSESRIATGGAAVHARPMAALAAREPLPTGAARAEVPATGPISPDSPQSHAKRSFAFILAGLVVIAFGAGVLFTKQITELLDTIAEYLHHFGIDA